MSSTSAARFLAVALLATVLCVRCHDGSSPTESFQNAIERGLAYLRHDRSDLSARVVLDYLQRRYDLPHDLSFAESDPMNENPEHLRLWGRMVGRDSPIDESSLGSLTAHPGVEAIVMHALYCDRFPLPSNYLALLRAFAKSGDYELTHAALALKILRDNGCGFDETQGVSMEEALRRDLSALIERTAPDPQYEEWDVRYEALAFLQDFLADRGLAAGHLSRVLREQQPDGGWRPEPDQPSRPHPTVLAVWALLARSYPTGRAIRFARD